MKPLNILIVLLYGFHPATAQHYIKATISGLPGGTVRLASVRGDQYLPLDSMEVHDGKIMFSLPGSAEAGMYKLIFPRSKEQIFYNRPAGQLDFIYNHKDVSLRTNFIALIDSMDVIRSVENETYYSFLKADRIFQMKLELLDPVINFFPEDDPFSQEAKNKYNALQREREAFMARMVTKHPDTYASKIIKNYRSPFLDAFTTQSERAHYFRQHYFDSIDFSDAALLNSPVYTGLVIRYLSLYRRQRISPPEQEDEFIKAVDVIMGKVNENPVVRDFILDYLIRGFEKFKMEKVLVHIADNYMDKDCKAGDESLMQKRMEAYRKMAVGQPAPEFVANDMQGRPVDLYDLPDEEVLLVFWASWCPHCNAMMPELKKWYEKKSGDVEVIAFSIDEDKAAWRQKVVENGYDWINCNDPAGWDGEVPLKYNIYATPTMFLLDRERRIIAKPLTVEELEKE